MDNGRFDRPTRVLVTWARGINTFWDRVNRGFFQTLLYIFKGLESPWLWLIVKISFRPFVAADGSTSLEDLIGSPLGGVFDSLPFGPGVI